MPGWHGPPTAIAGHRQTGMKLSRTVAYAVRATLMLAETETKTPVPCSRISKSGQMPERFLLQILRNLVTHGILDSTRGVDGGYMLNRHPDDISLLDVIEAIDGPMNSNVPTGGGLSEESAAKLGVVLQQITTTSRQQLEAIKLSNLITSPGAPSTANR